MNSETVHGLPSTPLGVHKPPVKNLCNNRGRRWCIWLFQKRFYTNECYNIFHSHLFPQRVYYFPSWCTSQIITKQYSFLIYIYALGTHNIIYIYTRHTIPTQVIPVIPVHIIQYVWAVSELENFDPLITTATLYFIISNKVFH